MAGRVRRQQVQSLGQALRGGDPAGRAGPGAARALSPSLAALWVVAALQAPITVEVGSVRVVAWEGDEVLAAALAEFAHAVPPWPGLPPLDPFPVQLFVTRSRARFDSITRGRLPGWSGAVAFPATNTIVLLVQGDPRPTLRHELAHLALHRAVPGVPLWFSEGYAALAAGEWDRLDALELSWALVSGTLPGFERLTGALRSGPSGARAAYALATTAVLFLHRLGNEHGLGPLLAAVRTERDFERGLRRAHLVTLAQFEALWHRDLRRRYGWLRLVTSFTLFWAFVAGLVGLVWWRRRRRDRVRRAALDEGWIVAADDAQVLDPHGEAD